MAIDEVTKYTHPSYGIIGFNRIQSSGRRRLFGSALNEHYHTIRVTIGHCERATEHGLDRFRSTGQIIEIELSAAQFAEAITAMNAGDGVPCTIARMKGIGGIEEPPVVMNESAHAKSDFKARMATFAKTLAATRAKVEAATEGKVITKDIRETIRNGVSRIAQEVGESIPWFVERYEEATEKISSAAKADADAWLTTAIHRAGLQGLRAALSAGSHDAPEVLALTAPKDPT
jgi:predicted secreted protein